jgi:hypothetical protein
MDAELHNYIELDVKFIVLCILMFARSIGQAVWGVGLNRSDAEIAGSIPTWGIGIRLCLPVLCCPT